MCSGEIVTEVKFLLGVACFFPELEQKDIMYLIFPQIILI